jgi:spore germination protein YaaH
MLKKLTFLCVLILGSLPLASQETDSLRIGIHQAESEFYSTYFPKDYEQEEKAGSVPSKLITTGSRTLIRKVLGWHPYWAASTTYLSYDYSALSHIAYFSYEVDTATGGYSSIHDWNSTPIIDYAHQRGTNVLLTVTNFGTSRNTELLTDTVKQKLLINNIITLLKSRNGDGVNFDLESVSVSRRNDLVSFIGRAVSLIKAQLPYAEISMATPAVDWTGAWDLKKLSEICDYLIVMGYNYYWSGSSTAGPVAPLDGENYNVTKTVITYLNAGVAPEKLLLGVPWYGYDWPVVSSARKSTTTGTGTARTFSAAEELANTYLKTFDPSTKVPWVSYSTSSALRQLWFDDNISLLMKYNFADSKNLAGIGIWALSYEGPDKEVWSTINNAFSMTLSEDNRITKIYPNPVDGIAEIQFTIVNKTDVALKIFDMLGKEIIVLLNGELEAGFHTEIFNSVPLAGGIYLCVLRTGKTSSTSKIIVIK